ncbi:response regulator transcription factor [Zunongwangia sp. F363]|uniref:Response regulator transcription factor n=1 Tax=Autumnicola tepida TaxID=3075595 RepID=A0ABU3CDA4_9FLAO|nr:response regulator transcription factor [Zunongwangia sp. F363]MDT0644327.1 response regulator transcription factor [Zunongwangia sp. F363]
MKKKIIIVDDHTLFAQSLHGLIKSYENFEVLKVCKNGKELMEYFNAGNLQPDLILLDIIMPVKNGLETMEWLKKTVPEQKALALSMEHDEKTIIAMLKMGCRGYLLKDIDPDEFIHAMNSVLNTGYYYSKEISELVINGEKKDAFELTSREKEFLYFACTEMTYKEVASEMQLSPKTIDGYRENLFGKLDVKSRTGLVLFAIKNNIYQI